MATKTIPSLTELTDIDENSMFPVDSGTQTYKALPETIMRGLMEFFAKPADWVNNISIHCGVSASALTITLKSADGTDLSSSNPGYLSFRSATADSGVVVTRKIVANITLTVPSGATLGTVAATLCDKYLYALDNAGTVELAIGMRLVDTGKRISTTIMSGSSDSSIVLYSATARTNVGAQVLGRISSTQAVIGTWDTAPTEITPYPFKERKVYATANTSTTTVATTATVVNFSNVVRDPMSRVTIGAGWNYLVDRPGMYSIKAGIHHGNNALTTTQLAGLGVYVNNALVIDFPAVYGNGATIAPWLGGSCDIFCLPGDVIDIRAAIGTGPAGLSGTATSEHIEIHYLGME